MWAQTGYKVAVLDLDQNQTCSLGFNKRSCKQQHSRANLHSVTVHKPLAGTLSKSLQALRRDYDITIIDSDCFSAKSTRKCLNYADFVLLPVLSNRFDIRRMNYFGALLQDAIKSSGRSIPVHIIINGVLDMRSNVASIKNRLVALELPETFVLQQVIHRRAIYEHCLIEGLSVDEMQLPYVDKKATEEMKQLFREINQSLNQARQVGL